MAEDHRNIDCFELYIMNIDLGCMYYWLGNHLFSESVSWIKDVIMLSGLIYQKSIEENII